MLARSALVLAIVAALPAAPASARSLASVKDSGTIVLCAHPNALPFAAKDGSRHGFQVELGQALARRLGVSLTQDWVITSIDIFRAECDIVMDSIADQEAQAQSGLRLSKPYRRSGVALAVPANDKSIRSLDDLQRPRKVGVLASSFAAMTLGQRDIETVPDLFEEDILTMLAKGQIDAAAVTPTSAGYYNLTHGGRKIRLLYLFDGEPNLSWNVAVGMRRPDPELRQAIDTAIDGLLADGTIKRIYARYGVTLQPPR